MTNLKTWFDKGMNKNEYINNMKVHQEHLLQVFNQFTLTNEDRELLHSFQSKQLKAVILTADWCGDAMVNLPILIRMADEALLETRYLIRDENLELMDQYLTNGKARSIPIIIFLNNDFEEVGKWGPRSPMAQQVADQLKETLPPKDSDEYEAAFKQFLNSFVEKLTTDVDLWIDIKNDILKILKNI
ncbi:thioredoxin family protein [Ferdinandcohnia quinoae]|uniref:Thioredoxin family protein n=1 Tax=Fredinandcohnia quinoae TaxID=2918902 RepID=A0AAW5DXD5_9BACI|nr:thioredoxin family protein [Fredinandcohnia sp. SECRCQ15]MCH1623984.1 thioredoxin family protein [Fredinandcohnia sp. SECRCQ15]